MSKLVTKREIEIDGKKYPLKFNFETMLNFEMETNTKFFDFINSLSQLSATDETSVAASLDLKKIAALFQSFLVGAGVKITVREAASLLDMATFTEFMNMVPLMVSDGTFRKESVAGELDKIQEETKEGDSPLESKPQE